MVDGAFLLLLFFQAQTFEQIRAQGCPVTGLLFSCSCPTLR
jgi:hypothetical protein